MAKAQSGSHVAAIVSDPAAPPDTLLVGGYPGASPFAGYERLYFDPQLSNWMDIPEDDVVHQQPIPGDPLGAVYAWIKKGSHILYKGQAPPADDDGSEAAPEVAASAAADGPPGKDDLKKIEGIGPKIEGLLNAAGIDTWGQLAAAPTAEVQAVLDAAGPRYRIHDPQTWARQAELAAAGSWDELAELQDRLKGGRQG